MGDSSGDVIEVPVMLLKQCDIRVGNVVWHSWSDGRGSAYLRCDVAEVTEGALLILQPLRCVASPTSQALHLHHLQATMENTYW